MLNHPQNFNIIEINYQDSDITISTASPVKNPEMRVTITQLLKSALPAPLEAEFIMRGMHWLKYLEEDALHWYVITSKFDGAPLFMEQTQYDNPTNPLNTQHLIQFLKLVSAYDNLPYSYQCLLLDRRQFMLSEGELYSNEILDLRLLTGDSISFDCVRKKFIRIVSHFIAQLIHSEPVCYHLVNWTPLYDTSENLISLSQLSSYWLKEIEEIQSRLKPLPLNELYVLESQSAQTPSAIRRQKEAAQQTVVDSLQQASKKRSNVWSPSIMITLAIALIMIGIFVLPNLIKDMSKMIGKPEPVVTETQPPVTTPVTPAPAVPKNDIAADSLEKLPIQQLAFLNGNLEYDTSRFYSGDRSVKFVLDANTPTASLALNDITLSKHPTLTLWMMSNQVGSSTLKVSFFKGDKLIHSLSYQAAFESADAWYMMNPLTADTSRDLSNADRMLIEFSGVPQTLWLDDFSMENYK